MRASRVAPPRAPAWLVPRSVRGAVRQSFAIQTIFGLPQVVSEARGNGTLVAWCILQTGSLVLGSLVVPVARAMLPRPPAVPGGGVRWLSWTIVAVVATFGFDHLAWIARRHALAGCAANAQPLLEAIERFAASRGEPPTALTQLVPDFLVAVPGTGLPAFPRFDYTRDVREGLPRAPWELSIDCPRRVLDFDTFFYWPTGQYPERAFGGRVERVGDWAYVHD